MLAQLRARVTRRGPWARPGIDTMMTLRVTGATCMRAHRPFAAVFRYGRGGCPHRVSEFDPAAPACDVRIAQESPVTRTCCSEVSVSAGAGPAIVKIDVGLLFPLSGRKIRCGSGCQGRDGTRARRVGVTPGCVPSPRTIRKLGRMAYRLAPVAGGSGGIACGGAGWIIRHVDRPDRLDHWGSVIVW